VSFEHVAQGDGQVGHLVEAFGRLVPQPFIDLLGTESLFAVLHEEFLQLFRLQFSNVAPGLCFNHFAKVRRNFERYETDNWN
jgi:hypothetical protein